MEPRIKLLSFEVITARRLGKAMAEQAVGDRTWTREQALDQVTEIFMQVMGDTLITSLGVEMRSLVPCLAEFVAELRSAFRIELSDEHIGGLMLPKVFALVCDRLGTRLVS